MHAILFVVVRFMETGLCVCVCVDNSTTIQFIMLSSEFCVKNCVIFIVFVLDEMNTESQYQTPNVFLAVDEYFSQASKSSWLDLLSSK